MTPAAVSRDRRSRAARPAGAAGSTYLCPICHRDIVTEARGGPHPSPGDHDPAYHVAKAYGTTHPTVQP